MSEKITPDTYQKFLEAHQKSLIVLFFDGEFTNQSDIVRNAASKLTSNPDFTSKVAVGMVDVEVNNDLATELSVLSVPMAVCLVNGKAVRKVDTLEPEKLQTIVKEELNRHFHDTEIDNQGDEGSKKEDPDAYLKKLINKSPIMIFMKGSPVTPRCGFSRQLVELLAKHNVTYDSYDILLNDEVRQGLKVLSDWPTYPQIYVKGEFIGGLDILKQLEETGELESTFNV